MNETIRNLGINFSLKGTSILETLIKGKKEVDDLSTKEVDQVLDAWETRKYVPIQMLSTAINSKPGHIEGETNEEYDRRHLKKIVEIVKGLD